MKKILTILIGLCFNNFLYAASSDMQASSCAPNGVTNVIKEKMNPRKFWIDQMLTADRMVAYWVNGEGAGEEGPPDTVYDCNIKNKDNPIERQKCVSYVKGEVEFWRRCGAHARQMCKLNGGFC